MHQCFQGKNIWTTLFPSNHALRQLTRELLPGLFHPLIPAATLVFLATYLIQFHLLYFSINLLAISVSPTHGCLIYFSVHSVQCPSHLSQEYASTGKYYSVQCLVLEVTVRFIIVPAVFSDHKTFSYTSRGIFSYYYLYTRNMKFYYTSSQFFPHFR